MKKSGIWIDSRKAWIIKLADAGELFEELISDVEDTHAVAGYGGSVAYQAQGAKSDDKILNRRKKQFKDFFDKIITRVKDSESILIEGPAEAKLGLFRKIKEDRSMSKVLLQLRDADKMTDNQFKAEVRQYFFKV